ncbi:MAG: ATP-binding cassette domain-containing protein [Phototrophicaceae bacterium]
MSVNGEYAILAQDVHKTYNNVKALNGMNLQVPKGKVIGLLGPNGAGKTTLVRIITTLLKPDSGTITIQGINVLEHPAQVRGIFGLAGQYPAVDEQLTGRENLVLVGELYHVGGREARQRAKDLLQRFSLTDAADRPVKTYSGGMRRRLDLAASIVARPPVLILDEPTTGLDPRTRRDLWVFIKELVQDGATLLLTTQYLEEADFLADRIVLIDSGKVVAEGTADELKSQIGGETITLQIEESPQLERIAQLIAPIGKTAPQVDTLTNTLILPVEKGTQSMVEVIRALDGSGVELVDIRLGRPTLDDVFLQLTGNSKP